MHPALVVFDWLINLDEEIRWLWNFRKGGKFNAAALLYGLSRYPTILLAILDLQTIFPMSNTVGPQSPCMMPCHRCLTGTYLHSDVCYKIR